ncbi:MAG: cysteine desulfurase / selenocysteine lyase [Gaiellales bacterium]|nr:cysteine desulfurase / selenocysteine lyase [Gaiellales bacterium]
MALETRQAVRPGLDVRRLRADFPILEREINGHPLVYLDSASSTQKPQAVIDSIVHTYSHSYANVHRGVYTLAEETTARYEGARETVRAFLGAESIREVIFVRDTTEGLNLVAYAWGRKHLRPGDVLVATEMEHHSNLVPWQFLANQTGALMRYVKVDDDGALDLASLERAAADGPVRLVAAVHVSNSLGTVNPIEELGAWCRAHDAVLVVDGAQSAPHRSIDVQALGCDFFAFSGHKLGGPGAGALFAREERLHEMDPFLTGGEMISKVTLDQGTSWNDLPYKFEAGTPAIAENIALGVAIDYLTGVGIEAVARHERELTAYAYERLAAIPDLRILGPGPGVDRGSVLSFALPDIHPHDLAAELDKLGICVRAGHHCTQPAMRRFGVPATTRVSFWLYSLPEEIDRLCDGLDVARKAFA